MFDRPPLWQYAAMMTADLLREAGEALFGSRWQSDLARNLNVTDRTMRYWASGSHDIPEGVAGELRRLFAARAAEMAAVRRKLPRSLAKP